MESVANAKGGYMEKKECLECGKEFDPCPEDERFCCYECYEWYELLRSDGY